jgi:hydroxymethylpyrimidine pyrophosphatase-like HAD family hydrolase
VDNGQIGPDTHTFHLIPAVASKAGAVRAHMKARGYEPEQCIAVGDSREDLEVGEMVGRFFLVANAVVGDAPLPPGAERTEAAMSEGFYEAVVRALAESR